MSKSNEGRELDGVLADVAMADVDAAAEVGWTTTRRHPAHASCACPTLEILALLYERGYRLIKDPA